MMTETVKPTSPQQLEDAISWALAGDHPLTVSGNGTKAGLGKPAGTGTRLDVSGLSGIVFYEPEELVLRARAGTPMSDIQALLEENNQQFMFEPIDYGPLFGGQNMAGSLGGLVAANLAGPRRLKSGAARDHLLGFEAVSGRGEAFKSGGRVMKNVSGFDLSKLMAGSFGTLGVMHTITMKTMPKDEAVRTIVLFGADDATAGTAMRAATASPHEVSAAAHLPGPQASLVTVGAIRDAGTPVTAIRVEGPAPSVDHRAGALQQQLGVYGAVDILDQTASRHLWAEIRDVRPFRNGDGVLIRISTAPVCGPKLVEALGRDLAVDALYDWAGGLVWLLVPGCTADQIHRIRQILSGFGGHATLIRADENLRQTAPVFQPVSGAERALTRRIKAAFDPKNILNPGRMED